MSENQDRVFMGYCYGHYEVGEPDCVNCEDSCECKKDSEWYDGTDGYWDGEIWRQPA